jgi:hypothetical protein
MTKDEGRSGGNEKRIFREIEHYEAPQRQRSPEPCHQFGVPTKLRYPTIQSASGIPKMGTGEKKPRSES